MRRELENNKRRKESAGLSYLGNTCRDKQPGGSNKQKERERKRGWDLRGGKKGKPNGSYGGGARYHKTKMTLFSLPFFCFCATTATTPLRHSSSPSSSVAAAAAAPAVPSFCCSHFLDFRSLNFSSISGISRRYENRIHRCHQQWDDDNTTPRRFTNVTVAADRSSINGAQSSARPTGTRKVVEHVVLFQMKEDFTDEQEKDMLDHLFTLQYRFRGILAISLGRVVGRTPEGVTHALYERFPSKETLEQYMQHPARLKVAEELIIPYYNGLIIADFEAEVEDAIETIFRRGDDFQQGIEHVVFIKVREGTSQAGVSRMLEAFNNLPDELESSILVQLTAGANFSERSNGYTHAMVARLPSEEALDSFSKHPAYVRVFIENVLPISSGILSADFMVDPVTKSNPL